MPTCISSMLTQNFFRRNFQSEMAAVLFFWMMKYRCNITGFRRFLKGLLRWNRVSRCPINFIPESQSQRKKKAPLSELIDKINEKFGTEFTNIDKVLEQIVSDMDDKEELRVQARNNSQEHFRFPFNDAFMDVVIGRMAQNQQFCERVLDDAKFGDTVRDLLVGVVYDRLRQPKAEQLR